MKVWDQKKIKMSPNSKQIEPAKKEDYSRCQISFSSNINIGPLVAVTSGLDPSQHQKHDGMLGSLVHSECIMIVVMIIVSDDQEKG